MLFRKKAAVPVTAAVAPVGKQAANPSRKSVTRPALDPEGELDVRALGRALWRRKGAIILPTILVAAAAWGAVHVITPQYRSSASILYEGRENIFLRPDAEKSQVERGPADAEALTSQVQLMLSRELALDLIGKLKLAELPEFDPLLTGMSQLRQALVMIGAVRNPHRMTAEERVLEAYYERLTAFALDRSRVITIEFESSDPQLAARVTNAVADGYLELQQSVRQQQTKAAAAWLEGEIEKLRPRVADAEAKAEAFRGKTNLFVGTNNTTLSNQQLGEFNSQLALARAQKADAGTRARLIRDMLRRGDPIDASDVINSELIRRLSEQRVTLRAQLAEQSSTLLDNHPRIKELRAQIADLDQQIRAEADKLVRSLENDARIADARVEALSANLDQLKRQAVTTNEQDVQLRALDREAKAQRELLESYLAKYREAMARETIGSAPPDTRIISRAVVSNTPYFPKKLPTILVATLASLVICVGFVTTGELMRHSPDTPVRGAFGPAAAAMGAAVSPRPGMAAGAADALAQALRAAGAESRRIAVFGVSRQAGTGMAALMLARALARDARVVLIDLGGGGDDIAAAASDPGAPGVAEVVRGEASFAAAITRDRRSRLHLVGAGSAGGEGAEIVASPRLAMMIDALARAYDHVVIDAGATFEAPLAQLRRLAPCAVLVATDPAAQVTRVAHERLAGAGYEEIALLDAAAAGAPAADPVAA